VGAVGDTFVAKEPEIDTFNKCYKVGKSTQKVQEKNSQSQNSIQHFEFSRTFFSTGSRAIAAWWAEWQAYQC